MVTGDQGGTASAIARELGLENGGELEAVNATTLSPLDHLSEGAQVFARVSPAHRFRIVRALQDRGRVLLPAARATFLSCNG
jgi:Ca2+-transporting ATPase